MEKDDQENREKNREVILEKLSFNNVANFVNNYKNYLSITNKQLCELLNKEKIIFLNGKYYSFTKETHEGKVGVVWVLQNKNDNTDKIVLKKIKNVTTPDYLSIHVYQYTEQGTLMNPSLIPFLDQNSKFKFLAVGSSSFINQSLLHFILNKILKDNPNYVYQYDAFICDGGGYNITKYAELGTLHEFLNNSTITNQLLMNVYNQINNALIPLKEYGFCHADLKGKNIFVDAGPIFKIADYDKSSITYNGVRFFNNSVSYLSLDYVPIKLVDNNKYYVINAHSSIQLQLYTMYNPYGFYLSYDYYTFLISLMSIDGVYDFFIKNPESEFSKLFISLFKTDEYDKVFKYLEKYRSKLDSLGYVNSMLVNLGLSLKYNFGYVTEHTDKKMGNLHISSNDHICLDECKIRDEYDKYKPTCNTNKYTKYLKQYSWDYC